MDKELYPGLTQAAEGEQETAERVVNIVVCQNGRVTLEPGAIIRRQKEEHHANGICEEFKVYLNGKRPDGKILRNVKKVILPKIYAYENGEIDPMDMTMVFGGCEDAAEIVKLMGEKCKLEIRAAVENWNQSEKVELHGHSYILDAMPLEFKSAPLKRGGGGTGLKIRFQVYRYAATVGDKELWDSEWGTQERTSLRGGFTNAEVESQQDQPLQAGGHL